MLCLLMFVTQSMAAMTMSCKLMAQDSGQVAMEDMSHCDTNAQTDKNCCNGSTCSMSTCLSPALFVHPDASFVIEAFHQAFTADQYSFRDREVSPLIRPPITR